MIHRVAARIVSLLWLLVATVVSVSAQEGGEPRYSRWWLPDGATSVAGRIDDLFYIILWITLASLVLVLVLLGVFLVRYRERAGRTAVYSHGNMRLEVLWTIIPAVIVIALAFASRGLWAEITMEMPSADKSLVVEVRPRQFQWDIAYAGADGTFGTADDITTVNQLHVPAGRDVLLKMSSQDVIHSFFVPEFRIKQDAVPGIVTQMWFNVPEPGHFEIACAELCGLGHYRMRGYLTVHAPADFDAWYAAQMATKASAEN